MLGMECANMGWGSYGILKAVDPDTEKLIDAAVTARARRIKTADTAERALDDYRAALQAAVATGVRGVKAELARRMGVSTETVRLDANDAARTARIAHRARGNKPEGG